ncbi:MAG TPA: response regulator transcription factor [Actinomycetota bacterium]|nr:response regulator transcription factor [Actinomycetota bacterium]
MIRLLWLASARDDPEESFGALQGRRPAPEPIPFSESTPELLAKRLVDVILVDGRRRGDEAAALIRKLRQEAEPPFVVVLEGEDLDRFDFSCGVSDFVLSGCTRVELDARLDRLTGSAETEPQSVVRRGDITINRDRFEVRVGEEVLPLTFKEFELIAYLADRPGKVCSRQTLLSEVWGYDFFGGTRTVDVHVRRLRAKLGHHAHAIETVRNVGYRFSG